MADQKDIQADKAEVPIESEPTVEDSPSSEQIEDKGTQAEVSVEEKSDQGKAFAAMRKEIADLKSQLETRTQVGTPPQPTPSYIPQTTPTYVDINQYVDPQSGEFNAQAYNQAVNSAIANQGQYNQAALNQNLDFAQTQMAYPALDPNSDTYDPEFEEAVAAKYHLLNAIQGKPITLREVAKDISQKRARDQKKEEAKIEEEHTKTAEEKTIASQETPGQSASGAREAQARLEEVEEDAELRARTRGLIGDAFNGKRLSEDQQLEATVKRLQKIPWVKPEEPETSGA